MPNGEDIITLLEATSTGILLISFLPSPPDAEISRFGAISDCVGGFRRQVPPQLRAGESPHVCPEHGRWLPGLNLVRALNGLRCQFAAPINAAQSTLSLILANGS